ncbi:hypothetical protein LJB89_00825 [Tyzzerella sp. OttesenSCG-928-J15]|nr:hypothetical protein [Tyzzerella sp. OttesenSCG-928-J15]
MRKYFYKDGKLNYELIFWAGLLFVMLAQAFYFGFNYYNYLDDNNTYGVFYRRSGDIWNNIVMWYKLYTFRPVAFMLDAYFYQRFWPCMEILLLIFILMTFATIVLFKKTMVKSGISFGTVGIIICALTPLNLEAAYWIGASTRFVPGMFFSILSCFILVELIDGKYRRKRLALGLYIFFNLISTGFYEQIVVFNFVFTLAVIILNYKKINFGKKIIIAAPFLNTLLIGAYYIIFWNHGKVASRGEMASGGLFQHFLSTFKGIANLLLPKNINMIVSGVKGFFNIEMGVFKALFLLAAIAFALICCLRILKLKAEDGSFLGKYALPLKLIGGIILAIAPFAPFFILKNNYMSFRAVYPSIFGIALFFDGLGEIISKNNVGKYVTAVLSGIVCIAFFMANATEINNYRLIEADDNIISQNFLEAFEKTGADDKTPIVVTGIKYLYTQTSRAGYENIASSDWAFLGKVNADSTKFYFTNILPVPKGGIIAEERLDGAIIFGIDDNMNIERLYFDEGDNTLYNEDNEVFGTLKADGNGYRKLEAE